MSECLWRETHTHIELGAELQGAKIVEGKIERESRSQKALKIGQIFLSKKKKGILNLHKHINKFGNETL